METSSFGRLMHSQDLFKSRLHFFLFNSQSHRGFSLTSLLTVVWIKIMWCLQSDGLAGGFLSAYPEVFVAWGLHLWTAVTGGNVTLLSKGMHLQVGYRLGNTDTTAYFQVLPRQQECCISISWALLCLRCIYKPNQVHCGDVWTSSYHPQAKARSQITALAWSWAWN